MLTRRELLQTAAVAPVATAASARPVNARHTHPVALNNTQGCHSRTARLMTGMPEVDLATAGISIGGITGLIGHGCSAKSSLALAVAQSVCEGHYCNVIFLSAREPPRWHIGRSTIWRQHAGKTLVAPDSWDAEDWITTFRALPPHVILASFEQWSTLQELLAHPASVTEMLNVGLIVLDGFGTVELQPVSRIVELSDTTGFMDTNCLFRPKPLSAELLRTISHFAATREIAMLLTIRNSYPDTDEPWLTRFTSTDNPLFQSIFQHCDRTLWLSKPKVWDKNVPDDTLEILTRWDTGIEHRQSIPFSV